MGKGSGGTQFNSCMYDVGYVYVYMYTCVYMHYLFYSILFITVNKASKSNFERNKERIKTIKLTINKKGTVKFNIPLVLLI